MARICRMGRSGMRRKGLEDLNVYRHQQEREAKVREDLNVQRRLGCVRGTGPRATGAGGCVFFSVHCEGQALALRAPGCVFL